MKKIVSTSFLLLLAFTIQSFEKETQVEEIFSCDSECAESASIEAAREDYTLEEEADAYFECAEKYCNN